MQDDETQIRQLVATWLSATRSGDIDTLLGLVAEDAVFLQPGRPPMRKPEFESASRAQSAGTPPAMDAHSEIQEIRILGDWAFMWTRLRVAVTPADGAAPVELAGHTLTVLQRQQGRWVLARDANLLAPVPGVRLD